MYLYMYVCVCVCSLARPDQIGPNFQGLCGCRKIGEGGGGRQVIFGKAILGGTTYVAVSQTFGDWWQSG